MVVNIHFSKHQVSHSTNAYLHHRHLLPVRHKLLASATMNDLASYSTNSTKRLKFPSTISMNDLQMCTESSTTPIRSNQNQLSTPMSIQRRRALGLVNHNSNQINRVSSIADQANIHVKYDSSMDKTICSSHPEDDLPHHHANYEDTFDDLIGNDERIERWMRHGTAGVDILNAYHPIGNTIRCQSPVCNGLNVSILLEMVDIFN